MTNASSQPGPGGIRYAPLTWRNHKVRRLIFVSADLARTVKGLASGGAYDLKLYLWLAASMQWIAGRDGKEGTAAVTQTFRALAMSIEMPLPTSPGTLTSRMHKMVNRLVEQKLLTTERIPGRGLVIRLLKPDGSGKPYQMPDPRGRGSKVFLDAEFFANGWHAVLSKHALALLLVACIEETRQWGDYGAKGRPGQWREARDVIERTYGIYHDAIDQAKKELAHYGLLFFEFDELNDEDRFFNNAPPHTYTLNKEVWLKTPGEAPRYEITYTRDRILEGSTTRWMRLNQPHFRRMKSRDGKVLPLHTEGKA